MRRVRSHSMAEVRVESIKRWAKVKGQSLSNVSYSDKLEEERKRWREERGLQYPIFISRDALTLCDYVHRCVFVHVVCFCFLWVCVCVFSTLKALGVMRVVAV